MPTYDTCDSAIIDATPERVFSALADEYAGRTHWWAEVQSRQLGDIPFGTVGAICESTVRNHGVARFKFKLVEIVDDHYIRFEYLEGDIEGFADVTLEPVGDKTRIDYRWRVKTRGKANILGPLLNIKRRHSQVMQSGFRALNEHLATGSKRAGSR